MALNFLGLNKRNKVVEGTLEVNFAIDIGGTEVSRLEIVCNNSADIAY